MEERVIIILLIALYTISAIYYIVYSLIKYKKAIPLKVASFLGFLLTSLTPFITLAFLIFVPLRLHIPPSLFLIIPVIAPSIFFFVTFFITVLALRRKGKQIERSAVYKMVINSFFVMIFASLIMLIALYLYSMQLPDKLELPGGSYMIRG